MLWCKYGDILTLYGDKYRKVFIEFVYADAIESHLKPYFEPVNWYDERDFWEKLPSYIQNEATGEIISGGFVSAFRKGKFQTSSGVCFEPIGWVPSTQEDYLDFIM